VINSILDHILPGSAQSKRRRPEVIKQEKLVHMQAAGFHTVVRKFAASILTGQSREFEACTKL